MAYFQFNTQQVAPDERDMGPLPKGDYIAEVCETDMGKPNAKGTVQLMVKWKVVEGAMKDRTLRNYVTVECPSSQTAQDIGWRFLRQLCESVGLSQFNDTDELCGRRHLIQTGIVKDNAGKEFAEVLRCKPAGQASAPATTQSTAPQAAAPATAAAPSPSGVKPPWAR
jgi:hypothetical protein